MKNDKTIRAWRDADFRAELSDEERALLPENPAGLIELTDEAMEDVVGGGSCICWSCDGGGGDDDDGDGCIGCDDAVDPV